MKNGIYTTQQFLMNWMSSATTMNEYQQFNVLREGVATGKALSPIVIEWTYYENNYEVMLWTVELDNKLSLSVLTDSSLSAPASCSTWQSERQCCSWWRLQHRAYSTVNILRICRYERGWTWEYIGRWRFIENFVFPNVSLVNRWQFYKIIGKIIEFG